MTTDASTGSCLCGAVRFVVPGPLRPVLACHCSQCRKSSGHFWASTNAPAQNVSIEGADALTWFQSSKTAKRGFCARCGSSLFWQREGDASLSIAAGSLDAPTGLAFEKHIFLDDASDYYRLHPDDSTAPGEGDS
jgi:hypothetical protein